jgi:hypothetical protein
MQCFLQIGELKAQLGATKGIAEASVAKMEAAAAVLDAEREIYMKREDILRNLVKDLQAEIKRLKV